MVSTASTTTFPKNSPPAAGLIPCFPSTTFPNFYSMATGLTTDHHGLIDMQFCHPHRPGLPHHQPIATPPPRNAGHPLRRRSQQQAWHPPPAGAQHSSVPLITHMLGLNNPPHIDGIDGWIKPLKALCDRIGSSCMNPKLVGITGPNAGQSFLVEGEDLIIGRALSCWVSIPTTLASRHHCRLSQNSEGHWSIADLDSHNGTLVNGRSIDSRQLSHGDQIQIGDSTFSFLLNSEPSQEIAQSSIDPLPDGAFLTQTITTVDPEECDLLHTASNTASQAEIQLRAILSLSVAIHASRDVEQICNLLYTPLYNITPASRIAILWRSSAGSPVTTLFSSTKAPADPTIHKPSHTVVDKVLSTGQAVLSREIATEPLLARAESLNASNIRSVLAVPLVVSAQIRGVLYLDSNQRGEHFKNDHLQFMTAAGAMVAVAIDNALRATWLENENSRLRSESGLQHEMVGESPMMQNVYEQLARVARSDTTVLILGESGTGKELAAKAVHRNSPRAARPFVAINCAAITETLIESELFGHEKGAFTGAVGQKKGRIEIAEGGTLFLDEIAELSPPAQAKLLRVLQEREFQRVGGTRTLRADIRLVAASNRSLEDAVQAGSFRQDLFYRLNVVAISMPPLRDRTGDIPLLAGHFLSRYAAKCPSSITGISPAARHCLLYYDWPGNVRELQNVIERAVVMGASDVILPEDLPEELHSASPREDKELPRYLEAVQETKRAQILQAVQQAEGNITGAAKLLGVHPNYLHRLIRNLGLRQVIERKGR
ncbi:MAG: sigma 54-interacting transcriptional regulator [Acidobacteriia bacterium]|nr:sigma 54-interacting transcriptional regulator [Terriglobia bacterium]